MDVNEFPVVVSPSQFTDRMRWITDQGGGEEGHIDADELMKETLTSLGYGEGIELFNNMKGVWYS